MRRRSRRPRVEAVSAFRWLANRIENAALECYMADPSSHEDLTKLLLQTIQDIEAAGPGQSEDAKKGPKGLGYGDCPRGWCPESNRCVPCSGGIG